MGHQATLFYYKSTTKTHRCVHRVRISLILHGDVVDKKTVMCSGHRSSLRFAVAKSKFSDRPMKKQTQPTTVSSIVELVIMSIELWQEDCSLSIYPPFLFTNTRNYTMSEKIVKCLGLIVAQWDCIEAVNQIRLTRRGRWLGIQATRPDAQSFINTYWSCSPS